MSLDVSLYNPDEIYEDNITHNLNTMAENAGIYMHLWRPEEIGITTAGQLIDPLEAGLCRLLEDPDHFKQFDASNGWGKYKHLVAFVSGYLVACKENPDATVYVSR